MGACAVSYDVSGVSFGDPRLPGRFWSKVAVNDNNGCWEWNAATRSGGYGCFSVGTRAKQRLVSSHRYAYQQLIADVPAELECDHLCRNRRCVNPAHIEVVSHRVNSLRGDGAPARNAVKTHCVRGHELSGDNLKIVIKSDGKEPRFARQCVTCLRMHYAIADAKRGKGRLARG
jgi:hypothetical protein